ncbi:MAG: SAM-dependent DNA methyltransferase [Anaerolineales bacterium]|nr:SAM-dependent DNA methyltransferase [Anaerolineales bacterium]
MLTDPKLRSQVDALWDKLWAGGLSNPMDAIEQFSYLLFFKRLDDAENQREKQAGRRGEPYQSQIPEKMRWHYWTKLQAADALKHVREKVFPWFKEMSIQGSSFQEYMQNAEFKINRPGLLIEACNAIDEMEISAQNQDVQGDLYEYLLGFLTTAGRAGQFRTPRHIIRMMVEMVDPKPGERIGDLAAGTCGFLVNAYEHILVKNTSPEILEIDENNQPHGFIGDKLTEAQRQHLQEKAFRGYDNDSGMTMLRIGSMNLMLHGIQSPHYYYMDTLSKDFTETQDYDVILMNPPFKGKVAKDEVSESLPNNTTKSELLFVHLILRGLDMGGRCAVIVPDGVLFGSSRAHVELRKKLIEENRLDGVVSMPSGVFKPYAGVSTAVLLFTRGAETENIWFYDMGYDGMSLDDKRTPTPEQNDIPDILVCWQNRFDESFTIERKERLEILRTQVKPLKEERLQLEAEINRLTFEHAIAPDDGQTNGELDVLKEKLAKLQSEIGELQAPIDQLTRQFWVSKNQVKTYKYDLSASRYHPVEQDEIYHEKPAVTMERLSILDRVMEEELQKLGELLQ